MPKSEIGRSYGAYMLDLEETTKLFFRMAVPFCIPIRTVWETEFFCNLVSFSIVTGFIKKHFKQKLFIFKVHNMIW